MNEARPTDEQLRQAFDAALKADNEAMLAAFRNRRDMPDTGYIPGTVEAKHIDSYKPPKTVEDYVAIENEAVDFFDSRPFVSGDLHNFLIARRVPSSYWRDALVDNISTRLRKNKAESITPPEPVAPVQGPFTPEMYITAFTELCDDMRETTRRKNADYAGPVDPFANFRMVEHFGIATVEEGILTRLTDKLARVVNILKREAQVADESILDTVKDMAVYSMILHIYLRHGK